MIARWKSKGGKAIARAGTGRVTTSANFQNHGR